MSLLIDYVPNWITGGLFRGPVLSWCPWVGELDIEELSGLDIEYFGNRSGYKTASPLIDKIAFTTESRELELWNPTKPETRMLRSVFRSMYGYEWERLWDAWKVQYEPLHNYDMTEVVDEHIVDDGSRDTKLNSKSDTDITYTNSIKPLNSSSYEGLSKTETNTDSQRLKADNTEDVKLDNDRQRDMTTTKSGNIGTLSYQDMLQKEIDLRKNHFFDIIMADLDKVLTIPYWR